MYKELLIKKYPEFLLDYMNEKDFKSLTEEEAKEIHTELVEWGKIKRDTVKR